MTSSTAIFYKKHLLFLLLGIIAHPAMAQQTICKLSETYADSMCADIYRVLGGKGQPPKVYFKPDDNLASSSIVGTKSQIHIDPAKVVAALEKTFGSDCATTDADDALAVIIGHEIWHILNKNHGLRFGFWSPQDYQTRNLELEADFHGLIGAWFAGKTRCMDIYQRIFPALKLSASASYPAISDRQRMEQQVRDRAQAQLLVYDAANCLLATNHKSAQLLAIDAYQYIGNRFHFLKEINFNIGLVNLQLALGDLKTGCLFPLEPAANPLSDIIPRASGGGAGNTDALLRDAEKYFKDALMQEPDYFEAWLGLTSVELLRHAYNPATKIYAFDVFSRGEKWKKEHSLVNLTSTQKQQLKMLEAIAYLMQSPLQEQEKAKKTLLNIEEKAGNGSFLYEYARYNRRIADPELRKNWTPSTLEITAPDLPTLDGISHNANVLFKTLENKNGWRSIGAGSEVFQQPLDNSDVICFATGNQKYVVQLYKKCPVTVRKATATTGKNTAPGNYRFLEGNAYDVVTWTEPDGRVRCAKIIKS